MNIKRRRAREVKIGNVRIGSSNPIAIQSMAKCPTKNFKDVIAQIRRLEKCGCAIVRVAVKDEEDAGENIDGNEDDRSPHTKDCNSCKSVLQEFLNVKIFCSHQQKNNCGNSQDQFELWSRTLGERIFVHVFFPLPCKVR